jgi:hypothetical protein
MNIQLSSKFWQHLPSTVGCQNLQLNTRHEGQQPDICICIELNEALPIHIHILPLVILPLVVSIKSLPLVTFTCWITLLGWTTIAWAGRGWTTTAGLYQALALCFSSLSSSSTLLLPLLFLHPYSIAPSPFLLFFGRRCGEYAGWVDWRGDCGRSGGAREVVVAGVGGRAVVAADVSGGGRAGAAAGGLAPGVGEAAAAVGACVCVSLSVWSGVCA